MHSLNLLARTLPIILVSMGSEMGRCNEATLGSWPGLGMKEILSLYCVGGRLEVILECFSMCKSRGDILKPNTLKNSTLKPSRPAAFLLGKEEINLV